jgi:hypothetical protein
MHGVKGLRETHDRRFDKPDARAAPAHRQKPQPALLRASHDLARVCVIDIDDASPMRLDQFREQPQLGGKIRRHRRMIIEVIAADIGEGTGRDPHRVKTTLIEPMRGGLHRKMGHALVGKRIERAVERDGIGRGERAIDLTLG